ncbi:MAG: PhoX family phosphatase [Pseudomonadota bacterium]
MDEPERPRALAFESTEDRGSSPEGAPTIGDIMAARLDRRALCQGLGRGLAAAVVLGEPLASTTRADTSAADGAASAFRFAELAGGARETHHVAPGYDADVLIRWGDMVLDGAPQFDSAHQTAEAQSRQFGYNNDFIGYLPIDGRSDHGLLVVNHEYTNEELMFPGLGRQDGRAGFAATTAEHVAIEMAAHGGTVIEVRREAGKWRVIDGSRYARRITAETAMRLSGPAAGHRRMCTSADPAGLTVQGMINNCAGATTPWGTWLTCEENFNGYFWGKDARARHPDADDLARYGIPGEWFAWGRFHDRFDIAKEPNEPSRFGWVVEIDPFDPNSVPVKRTALGRFKHEGAGNVVNRDGRFVVYQGDDERFEHVYRFISDDKVDLADRGANRDLLDHGTLSVARFLPDGRGEWLALVHGRGPLTAANGFADQGDVVIRARQAADLLGATRMDRPEDVEVSPVTGKVYVMLTRNERRKAEETDAANPRGPNPFGHIIEIVPDDGDHAAAGFRWEILVRCGDPAIGAVGATFNPSTSARGWFSSPDNCVFDALGRLWVATDGNVQGAVDGLFALDTDGNARGRSRHFFSAPIGAEVCGPCFTPDLETLFLAVQHPGQTEAESLWQGISTYDNPTTRWPDFVAGRPPRPAVVAITRMNGGRIGA